MTENRGPEQSPEPTIESLITVGDQLNIPEDEQSSTLLPLTDEQGFFAGSSMAPEGAVRFNVPSNIMIGGVVEGSIAEGQTAYFRVTGVKPQRIKTDPTPAITVRTLRPDEVKQHKDSNGAILKVEASPVTTTKTD